MHNTCSAPSKVWRLCSTVWNGLHGTTLNSLHFTVLWRESNHPPLFIILHYIFYSLYYSRSDIFQKWIWRFALMPVMVTIIIITMTFFSWGRESIMEKICGASTDIIMHQTSVSIFTFVIHTSIEILILWCLFLSIVVSWSMCPPWFYFHPGLLSSFFSKDKLFTIWRLNIE